MFQCCDLKKKRSKENEYYIILRKLVKKDKRQRKEFEFPKLKIQDLEERVHSQSDLEYIPHSSLIKRLKELLAIYSVEEFDSGKVTKRKLPIKEYSITTFGFVKLISLCEGKSMPKDIVDYLFFHFPKISDNLKALGMVIKKNHLLETLVDVCKNIDIYSCQYSEGPCSGNTMKTYVTAAELLKVKNGILVFQIESLLEHLHTEFLWRNRMVVYSELVDGVRMYKTYHVEAKLSDIVSATFFHKLQIRCRKFEYSGNYQHEIAVMLLNRIIRNETNLAEIYLELLNALSSEASIELDLIKDLRRVIGRNLSKKSIRLSQILK